MVGPEAYTEVRYLADRRLRRGVAVVADAAARVSAALGRDVSGLVQPYACRGATPSWSRWDRSWALWPRWSTSAGPPVTRWAPWASPASGRSRRPPCEQPWREPTRSSSWSGRWPRARTARSPPRSLGQLAGSRARVRTVVAGLGGRPVTAAHLHGLLDRSDRGRLGARTFLDLDRAVVGRELAKDGDYRRWRR